MRVPHLLRRTNTDRYPRNIICLACDARWHTSNQSPYTQHASLISWVAVGFSGAAGEYGEGHWCEGRTADEWWEQLGRHLHKRGATSIYCANADMVCSLLDLWGSVERGEIDLGGRDERDTGGSGHNGHRKTNMRVVLESPPFILQGKVSGASGEFKIVDVANYGLQSGDFCGPIRGNVSRVRDFVRGVCTALVSRKLGGLKDTAATQAYSAFKRRHLTHAIELHCDTRALAIEGDSYYGGRCEAFRVGRVSGPIYHLDVSSMYPYCARESDVPVALAGYCGELGAGDQPQLGEGCGLIADVTLETDEPAYPYRDRSNGVTVWPIGVYRTCLAGPELQDALVHDRVVRWHRAAWYHMSPALRSYAECVLDMRREYGDSPDLKTWSKALGVSLIGKFGQRERKWVDAASNVMHGPWDAWYQQNSEGLWSRYRSVQWSVQREEIGSWSYDAVPAIASWVCSAARMRLLSMIRCAGWGDTLYCDTDALMVSQNGYSRLVESGWVRENEPGFLRIKNVSNEVIIHGIKAYDEEGRSVRLGQPLSVARAAAGDVRYWARRSAAGSCRERRAPQAERVAIRHDRTDEYRHGLVCADGTVTPFQLNEG